jgi:small subunit ribosomal protein S6
LNYETVLIVDALLDDAVRNDEFEKVTSLIRQRGELTHVAKWGKRKLAYPIRAKWHGDYAVFSFQGDGALVKELEQGLLLNEKVLRFLTVRMDMPVKEVRPEPGTEVRHD